MAPLSRLPVWAAIVCRVCASDTCAASDTCSEETSLLQGANRVRTGAHSTTDEMATLNTETPSYIGCFIDDGSRDLQDGPQQYGYTSTTCAVACDAYIFFALQNNGWCVCGNAHGTESQYRQVADNQCGSPCAQESSGYCGAGWRNAMFQTHGAPPEPEAPDAQVAPRFIRPSDGTAIYYEVDGVKYWVRSCAMCDDSTDPRPCTTYISVEQGYIDALQTGGGFPGGAGGTQFECNQHPQYVAPPPVVSVAVGAVTEIIESYGAQAIEVQYTPDQADWSTFQSKTMAVSSITGHDPDAVGWIRASAWVAAQWDGTPYNPSQMSRSELFRAICPTGDTIRGIREVFYQHNPFADNTNPTKAEVDEWHRIAINHVRALVGYTQPERQVQKDHCMFARALWGQQRKFTQQWDAEYPGQDGSAYGPCQGGGNGHCGATFLPSAEDQEEFLPESHPSCTLRAGSEGVFSAAKADIPWSIKWSRVLCSTLGTEGFWGGHTGPFFHREKFGLSFWDSDPENSRSMAVMRGKWTGNLMPNLYEQR